MTRAGAGAEARLHRLRREVRKREGGRRHAAVRAHEDGIRADSVAPAGTGPAQTDAILVGRIVH